MSWRSHKGQHWRKPITLVAKANIKLPAYSQTKVLIQRIADDEWNGLIAKEGLITPSRAASTLKQEFSTAYGYATAGTEYVFVANVTPHSIQLKAGTQVGELHVRGDDAFEIKKERKKKERNSASKKHRRITVWQKKQHNHINMRLQALLRNKHYIYINTAKSEKEKARAGSQCSSTDTQGLRLTVPKRCNVSEQSTQYEECNVIATGPLPCGKEDEHSPQFNENQIENNAATTIHNNNTNTAANKGETMQGNAKRHCGTTRTTERKETQEETEIEETELSADETNARRPNPEDSQFQRAERTTSTPRGRFTDKTFD